MAKQILKIEPIKSLERLSQSFNHNYFREPLTGQKPEHINPELTKYNEELISIGQKKVSFPMARGTEEKNYASILKQRRDELPYYNDHNFFRKGGTFAFEFVMSYGEKEDSPLPEDFDLDKWKEQNVAWLIDTYGRENVMSAVLHMDEGTPHIHVVIIPEKDGKIRGSALFPNRESMRAAHESYDSYMSVLGLEAPDLYKQTTSEKLGKFYNNVNKSLEKSIPEPEEGEDIVQYSARINEFYKEMSVRSFSQEYQIAQLKKDNESLERSNRYMGETLQKEPKKVLKKALEKLGGIDNAVEAVKFKEQFDRTMAWLEKSDPDLSRDFTQIYDEIEKSYNDAQMKELEKIAEIGED